jgi:AcrR family transcriptional regulator
MTELPLKKRIVTEALRQFSTKGFLATSTSDLIDAVSSSKGGLYNHFKSKEQIFFASLQEARKIWRERNLAGLEQISHPIDKIVRLLENYRDNYLADKDNFPGGCIFVNFTIELSDQMPHLADAVNEGFVNFKSMLLRLLQEARRDGEMRPDAEPEEIVEIVFTSLLGACVLFTADKSKVQLDRTLGTLIDYVKDIRT